MAERPLIAITMGDPAGVGPEIVAGSLAYGGLYEVCRPLVVGDAGSLRRAAQAMGVSTTVNAVASAAEGTYADGTIDVLDLANVPADLEMGTVQGVAGKAAFDYIERATRLALTGDVDAIATAPVNKEAMRAGGVKYLDHTAAFAALADSPAATTMFVLDRLRIFFATRHMSLRAAIDALSVDSIAASLVDAHEQLERFGFARPHIALAALNPHGGEHGMFGDEEGRVLAPAVEQARARGVNATGPHPADSVFSWAKEGGPDAVMSLYHDQGHIASKSIDFDRTTTITTGLPFVRSSVDHGTAFDIAGKGTVRWITMAEAVKAGAEFALRLRGAYAQPAGSR